MRQRLDHLVGRSHAPAVPRDGRPDLRAPGALAPTQFAPVVRLDGAGQRELAVLRWGLVPSWARDPAIGSRTFNARAETVIEKPAFRDGFRQRRCLVPADGFYEWKFVGGRKQPYRIGMSDGGLFDMAGLWERWAPPGAEPIESFTILTTQPNALVVPIYDGMPVILDPRDYDIWLFAGPAVARALLQPYPAERIAAERIAAERIAAERIAAEPVSRRMRETRVDDRQAALPL